MHAAAKSYRGKVTRRTANLRGQAIIEYVLITAIIGLVVVFAGPQAAGAIRNQFEAVTDKIDEGTNENAFKDAEDVADPEGGTAFAVYSADDNSLMFYKRRGVPQVGEVFNNRRVTEVYTGFETEKYEPVIQDDFNGPVNTPWYDRASACLKVQVVDFGIKPAWMEYWFQDFRNCANFNLSLLDTSDVTSLGHIFYNCSTVRSIDLSGWDFSSATTQTSMFACCSNLELIDFGDWVPDKLRFYGWMFDGCRSLSLDCSDWNVPPSVSHTDFASDAPGVILPKAWK